MPNDLVHSRDGPDVARPPCDIGDPLGQPRIGRRREVCMDQGRCRGEDGCAQRARTPNAGAEATGRKPASRRGGPGLMAGRAPAGRARPDPRRRVPQRLTTRSTLPGQGAGRPTPRAVGSSRAWRGVGRRCSVPPISVESLASHRGERIAAFNDWWRERPSLVGSPPSASCPDRRPGSCRAEPGRNAVAHAVRARTRCSTTSWRL